MTVDWDEALRAAERGHPASLAALVLAHGVPDFARERVARVLVQGIRPKGARPKEVRDEAGRTKYQQKLWSAVNHCRRLKAAGTPEAEAIAATVRLFGPTRDCPKPVTATRLQHVLHKGLPPENSFLRVAAR